MLACSHCKKEIQPPQGTNCATVRFNIGGVTVLAVVQCLEFSDEEYRALCPDCIMQGIRGECFQLVGGEQEPAEEASGG